jgi:hypothetical protein
LYTFALPNLYSDSSAKKSPTGNWDTPLRVAFAFLASSNVSNSLIVPLKAGKYIGLGEVYGEMFIKQLWHDFVSESMEGSVYKEN